jgi:hypothetical protein
VASVGNPDLVLLPDGGLRVFHAGLTGSESTLDGVLSASAGRDGATWTPTTKVSSTSSAIGEGVGADMRPDGTFVFAYAYSFVLGLHTGLDPGQADIDLLADTKCCAYFPEVAFAASGEGYLAWYSNVEGDVGLWVQQIAPTMGTKRLVPGSVTDGRSLAPDQRTAIVARRGSSGGIYVAYCTGYPTCTTVKLWKVGTAAAIDVATGRDIEDVNIAAAPDGRIWVMWQDVTAGRIYAARSNADATAMGGPAAVAPQTGATVWKLTGDGTADQLDLFASMSVAATISTWHTQVLPGLGVEVEAAKRATKVVVTDADRPVKGAKVALGKKQATTDRRGRATIPGKRKVAELTVARVRYTTAVVTLGE